MDVFQLLMLGLNLTPSIAFLLSRISLDKLKKDEFLLEEVLVTLTPYSITIRMQVSIFIHFTIRNSIKTLLDVYFTISRQTLIIFWSKYYICANAFKICIFGKPSTEKQDILNFKTRTRRYFWNTINNQAVVQTQSLCA